MSPPVATLRFARPDELLFWQAAAIKTAAAMVMVQGAHQISEGSWTVTPQEVARIAAEVADGLLEERRDRKPVCEHQALRVGEDCAHCGYRRSRDGR